MEKIIEKYAGCKYYTTSKEGYGCFSGLSNKKSKRFPSQNLEKRVGGKKLFPPLLPISGRKKLILQL